MIFYNIKELEKRLIAKTITEKEIFNYFLVYFIIATILTFPTVSEYNNPWIHWIDVTLDLIVTVVGIKVTWDTNANGDNTDYFKRFISLAFVNTIRIIIKIIAVGILLFLLIDLFLPDNFLTGLRQDIFEMTIGIIFQIVFYYRLNQSFTNVSRHRSPE